MVHVGVGAGWLCEQVLDTDPSRCGDGRKASMKGPPLPPVPEWKEHEETGEERCTRDEGWMGGSLEKKPTLIGCRPWQTFEHHCAWGEPCLLQIRKQMEDSKWIVLYHTAISRCENERQTTEREGTSEVFRLSFLSSSPLQPRIQPTCVPSVYFSELRVTIPQLSVTHYFLTGQQPTRARKLHWLGSETRFG